MRTTLVSGATGGIGRAVCAKLAANGDRLILSARSEQRLQDLAAALPPSPIGAHECLAADMADEHSLEGFEASSPPLEPASTALC